MGARTEKKRGPSYPGPKTSSVTQGDLLSHLEFKATWVCDNTGKRRSKGSQLRGPRAGEGRKGNYVYYYLLEVGGVKKQTRETV